MTGDSMTETNDLTLSCVKDDFLSITFVYLSDGPCMVHLTSVHLSSAINVSGDISKSSVSHVEFSKTAELF